MSAPCEPERAADPVTAALTRLVAEVVAQATDDLTVRYWGRYPDDPQWQQEFGAAIAQCRQEIIAAVVT